MTGRLIGLALVFAAALGGFAIYTFGWRHSSSDNNDAGRARQDAGVFLSSQCSYDNVKGCRVVSMRHVSGSVWLARVASAKGNAKACISVDVKRFEVFYSPSTGVADRFHGAGWFSC